MRGGKQVAAIDVLEEEALRNFETGRYVTAARMYEHLSRKMAKTGELLKALRYGVEAVQAWIKTESPKRSASVLFAIGTECIRAAAQFFEHQGRQELNNKPPTAARALKQAAISYDMLGNSQKRNELFEEAGTLFEREARKLESAGDTLCSFDLFERAKDCFQAAGKGENADYATYLAVQKLIQLEKDGALSLSGEGYVRVAELLEGIGEEELATGYREIAKRLAEQ